MTDCLLKVESVHLSVKQKTLLHDVSFEVRPGECIALLGANGAGKTSLLKALLGIHAITAGEIALEGRPLSSLSALQRARQIAYLPQARELAWPMSIESVIGLGVHHSNGKKYGERDGKCANGQSSIVETLLDQCDLNHLRGRSTLHLSGGELARVHIARLLASQAPLLLIDEPIAELDPLYQLSVLALIREYVGAGNSAIVALHDIALAAQFANRIVVLKQGELFKQGTPSILTSELLADVYGIDASVETIDGYSVLVNRGRGRQ